MGLHALFPVMIVAGVLLVLAALSLFTVNETQYAIRTEFGAIVGTHYRAGAALQVALGQW